MATPGSKIPEGIAMKVHCVSVYNHLDGINIITIVVYYTKKQHTKC